MSNSDGRNDDFLAEARKLSILPTSLDIFHIRQHYIRILYIHQCHESSISGRSARKYCLHKCASK